MSYNLYRLNPISFERMIQSLMQKKLGDNSIVFGSGADGARELTFEGKASFPNETHKWEGYWVVQAKYKERETNDNDYTWIERNFKLEMEKFQKKNYKNPDNYIFLTNAVLTPKVDTGGRDKIEKLKKSYSHLIPNIFIGGYDEISSLLDNNRDVATAYASFILTGDILQEILKFYQKENNKSLNEINVLKQYLENEFKSEQISKLVHAGDLTNRINLENVFTDLLIKSSTQNEQAIFAIDYIINTGNEQYRLKEKQEKTVLIGGAGAGKSTITQFTIQLYTAFFLKNVCNSINIEILNFIEEHKSLNIISPVCFRIPFKIVLKDLAGWINENKGKKSISILSYLKFKINIETGEQIGVNVLKNLLTKLSFIFIFDGLDEVPTSSSRELVLKKINDFVEVDLYNLNCDATIIATTRPQGYSSEFDKDKYKHFYITDMTDEICMSYLTKLISNIESSVIRRNDYLKTLESSLQNQVTSNLMRTPLQATIMAVLVVSGGEPSSNKYGLFKEYYNTIFKREKQKKVSRLINEHENKIHKIHNILGFKLQHETENMSNTYSLISKTDFENLIIVQLKEDEWNEYDIMKFVEEFRNTITHRLVFISEVQDEKIGFVVRSLQEFFAANFYMDAADTLVKDRISSISTNSYWRNTLLFSIGYIKANKEHLIDHVYNLCEILNGIELGPNESDYRSILKLGSNLSLDILSEGILNDSPKYVNRFSRLLEPLIININTEDSLKFNRLQNRIKKDWIFESFMSNLDMSKLNYWERDSIFNINFILLNSNESQIRTNALNFLQQNVRNENLYIILKNLFNFGERDQFFFDIFIQAIVKSPILELEFFIVECINENRKFINYALNNVSFDFATRRVIIENILLIFVSSYSADDVNLQTYSETLSIMSGKDVMTSGRFYSWSYLSICLLHRQIELSDGIAVSLYSTTKTNLHLYEIIKEISTEYNITYFVHYCNYNLYPSKQNLIKFIDSIEDLPRSIKEKFTQAPGDWFLKHCLNLTDTIATNNYKNEIQNIGDSELDLSNLEIDLIENRNVIDVLYFSTSIVISGSNSVNNRSKAASYFMNMLSPQPISDYKVFVVSTKMFEMIYKGYGKPANKFEVTKDVFNLMAPVLTNTEFIKTSYDLALWFDAWVIAFQCENLQVVFNTVVNSDCFGIFQYDSGLDFLIQTTDNSLRNIFKIFNSAIALGHETSFIRFVRYLLFSNPFNHHLDLENLILDINFRDLEYINYTEIEDQISKFQILMLAPTPYTDDEIILDHIVKYITYNENFFKDLVRGISIRNLENIWQKKLILKLTSRNDLPPDFFLVQVNITQIRSIAESIPVTII